MSESKMRAVANNEIDNYSISILGYDRENPRDGQRTPGDVIRDAEARMQTAIDRRELTKKYLGTVVSALTVAVLTAVSTAYWPAFKALLGVPP